MSKTEFAKKVIDIIDIQFENGNKDDCKVLISGFDALMLSDILNEYLCLKYEKEGTEGEIL